MTEINALPILIVDDDEPTQKLLQAVLRRSGFESETTANGRSAIALLQEKNYAAVILDIMMPEVSGHEVIDFLVADGRGVPVIVCSAAGPKALGDLNAEVVKAVVRKPFDVEQFVLAVRASIGAP